MSNASKSPMSSTLPPPFFVVGCPRSGTSLVSQLLDSHSRIAVYFESYYYPIFRSELHHYGDLRRLANLRHLVTDLHEVVRMQGVMNPPEVEEFLGALVAPTFEGVLSTLLYLYAQRQGKVRSGDKTPEHYAHLGEILEAFPESPVIFVMRDPRDTVLSIRKSFGTSLQRAMWMWNQAFLSYQGASRPVHPVRYEELVQKPAEVVQAMCAFLGEEYEASMLRFFDRTPKVAQALLMSSIHQRLLGSVDAGSVGRFRQMSSDEIERIEAGCGAGMEAMGYPLTTLGLKPVKMKPPTKLNFLLDRLRYYRGDRRRWQRGWMRWKIVLRVRARYLLSPGVMREYG